MIVFFLVTSTNPPIRLWLAVMRVSAGDADPGVPVDLYFSAYQPQAGHESANGTRQTARVSVAGYYPVCQFVVHGTNGGRSFFFGCSGFASRYRPSHVVVVGS